MCMRSTYTAYEGCIRTKRDHILVFSINYFIFTIMKNAIVLWGSAVYSVLFNVSFLC